MLRTVGPGSEAPSGRNSSSRSRAMPVLRGWSMMLWPLCSARCPSGMEKPISESSGVRHHSSPIASGCRPSTRDSITRFVPKR